MRNGFRRSLRSDEIDQSKRTLRTIQAGSQFVKDGKTQEWRVSSGAFSPGSDGCVSVDLEQLLLADLRPIDALFPGLPRALGLVAHKIAELRSRDLSVSHEQVPGNYYHGCITGTFTPATKRALANNFEIIRPFDTETAERLLTFSATVT